MIRSLTPPLVTCLTPSSYPKTHLLAIMCKLDKFWSNHIVGMVCFVQISRPFPLVSRLLYRRRKTQPSYQWVRVKGEPVTFKTWALSVSLFVCLFCASAYVC